MSPGFGDGLTWNPTNSPRRQLNLRLASRDPEIAPRPIPRNLATQTLVAYRYVADRLCHRIRNGLALPSTQLLRLRQLLADITDEKLRTDLTEILSGFQTGLQRISRTVEFDTGDGYLTWQTVVLVSWLESAASEFAARFGPATLAIASDPAVRRVKIKAARFYLDTIFGNLWSNATQAVEPPCRLELQLALDFRRSVVDIVVVDNGPGFTEMHLETAFQQVFSTKSDSRGRGLLEVADAVLRLQGTVELMQMPTGEYRVHIAIPVEEP